MGLLVKTKYKIGDRVWFVSDNRVTSTDITGVRISAESGGGCEVEYTLHYSTSWRNEDKLYKSKKELIESL